MAVFLLLAKHGSTYSPPGGVGIFADMQTPGAFQNFAEALYNQSITSGCGVNPLRYCPDDAVTRGQMAVFLSVTFNLQ